MPFTSLGEAVFLPLGVCIYQSHGKIRKEQVTAREEEVTGKLRNRWGKHSIPRCWSHGGPQGIVQRTGNNRKQTGLEVLTWV